MRIQIISDLHHEFGISLLDFKDIDLLIIAGDLDVGVKGIEWLKANIKDIPVIYVADYTIGKTQIICNPHGYIHEKYNGYNPRLIIHV